MVREIVLVSAPPCARPDSHCNLLDPRQESPGAVAQARLFRLKEPAGYRILMAIFAGASIVMAALSTLPPVTGAVGLMVVIMGLFGMGNGAVFQLVPQRFAKTVGIMTGLVGAAGGIGGFFLPSLLGVVKDRTGSYSVGFLILSAGVAMGFAVLMLLGPTWLRNWEARAGERCGIFSYRAWFAAEEAA